MVLSGQSPDGRLVEIVELQDHPWFVASQFHPEFKSRPERPHPLFDGFVAASISADRPTGAEPVLRARPEQRPVPVMETESEAPTPASVAASPSGLREAGMPWRRRCCAVVTAGTSCHSRMSAAG